jgi:hypothetical protein
MRHLVKQHVKRRVLLLGVLSLRCRGIGVQLSDSLLKCFISGLVNCEKHAVLAAGLDKKLPFNQTTMWSTAQKGLLKAAGEGKLCDSLLLN